jgi:hypothetical protein
MSRLFTVILVLAGIQLSAGVKIENVYHKKKLAGYLVSSRFFSTVLFAPNELKSDQLDSNLIRGGWFRSASLKNSDNLLGACKTSGGIIHYGIAQIFEPLVEAPENQKEMIFPGVGRAVIEDNGSFKIKEFFPWESSITYEDKNQENATISFLQDSDTNKRKLDYKMRIDCKFTDSSVIELRGIFFNLGQKTLKARISPTAIFNNNDNSAAPWIVVPYQRAKLINGKRITYIDCNPVPVKDFRERYEFSGDRLSKAKRWIAVGGLRQKGLLSFISEAAIEKVVFWKTENCFSVLPYINITADPGKRVEWSWKIVVGRGLDTVSNVNAKGTLGVKMLKYMHAKKPRYKCKLQFLPTRKSKDMVMDVLVKSSRGTILGIKSYEMFDSSPLKPESIDMKLPKRLKPNNRYSIKVEVLKDSNIFMTIDHWLFPE